MKIKTMYFLGIHAGLSATFFRLFDVQRHAYQLGLGIMFLFCTVATLVYLMNGEDLK